MTKYVDSRKNRNGLKILVYIIESSTCGKSVIVYKVHDTVWFSPYFRSRLFLDCILSLRFLESFFYTNLIISPGRVSLSYKSPVFPFSLINYRIFKYRRYLFEYHFKVLY